MKYNYTLYIVTYYCPTAKFSSYNMRGYVTMCGMQI